MIENKCVIHHNLDAFAMELLGKNSNSNYENVGTVHFCLKAWKVIMWSASSVMMHALTGVNALLKMFYTTKEITGNCPKMNRLKMCNQGEKGELEKI
jgi:hypothetical protein